VEMTSVRGPLHEEEEEEEEEEEDEEVMETIYDDIDAESKSSRELTGGEVINFNEDAAVNRNGMSSKLKRKTSSSASSRATDNPIRFDDVNDTHHTTNSSFSTTSTPNPHAHEGEAALLGPPPYTYREQVLVSVGLWISTLAIALVFRELGVVSALTGMFVECW
jgi:hypothetical protein